MWRLIQKQKACAGNGFIGENRLEPKELQGCNLVAAGRVNPRSLACRFDHFCFFLTD
jgi:hypothetical protein